MINPLVKVIELFVDEEQDAILESISIVDKPAIEREFMYFSEDGRQMLYFQEVEDQRIVVSPAMIPDKMIPRKDKNGSIYYVYFSKDTVAKAAEYLMKYNKQSHSNVNHQRIYSNDMYVMESWIKESENDKSADYGFADLPVGSWFVKFRILNDEVWDKIKQGQLRGLSVEGDFLLGAERYQQMFARYKSKYAEVRQKYKRVYKGLADDEKAKLDAILYLVELVNSDAYATPEEAVKRSKELGLRGEIRSEYNEITMSINYLPGPDQTLYEAALLKQVDMEIEVAGLPNYVNQGETGPKALSQLEFADPKDLKIGDEVSWKTQDTNPRGRIREIIREGSKKVPGADFEITGTAEDPGYLIEIYKEDAEGNWKPTDKMVGKKADSILKNVQLAVAEDFVKPAAGETKDEYIGRCVSFVQGEGKPEDQALAICYSTWENMSAETESFARYFNPLEKNTLRTFINDIKLTYGI
jgi:hypothetical protein